MGVEIRKGRNLVSNIFGAISCVKETNLTACLGYLIASFPEYFSKKFLQKKKSTILSVYIEEANDHRDRFDIVLNCIDEVVVIEAKIGLNQTERQISRYLKHLKSSKAARVRFFILDKGSFDSHVWLKELSREFSGRVEIGFLTWEHVYKTVKTLLLSKRLEKDNPRAFYLAQEFNDHLEEAGMVQVIRKEIYTKDVSGHSIDLFFRHRIYKCQPKFYNSASGNAYFAPYFTGRAPLDFEARSMIKIKEGISWIAPILDTQVIARRDVKDFLKSKSHPNYLEAAKQALHLHKENEMTILLLGEPFLAFLTPISKKKIGLTGAMGSKSLTFKDLFQAAGKAH